MFEPDHLPVVKYRVIPTGLDKSLRQVAAGDSGKRHLKAQSRILGKHRSSEGLSGEAHDSPTGVDRPISLLNVCMDFH